MNEIPASRRNHAEVTATLRGWIEAGRWQPQEALPPERALAVELACSRETLRRALHTLSAEGQIWRHQGKGTFLGPGAADRTLPLKVLIESASTHDLIEARLVFEPALAAAAALAAKDSDISRMRELATETGTAANWRDYERLDDAFHRSIAQASANALLIGLYTNLVAMRGRAHWQRHHDAVYRKAQKLEYATAQRALHLAIVEAIAARDQTAAHRAMTEHLTAIRRLLREAEDGLRSGRA
ncbi:FadR/GntR family transcriptional regulator [Paracoccus sp. KR1-242]|uniref:FadR/GntR family transcriptional regulator n=1 Tax=Paracoccus sp. KR1-242 TaxID=3410028 RepID=UPI003BFBD729